MSSLMLLPLLLDSGGGWSLVVLEFAVAEFLGRGAKGSKSGSKVLVEPASLGAPDFLFGKNAFHHLALSVVIFGWMELEQGADVVIVSCGLNKTLCHLSINRFLRQSETPTYKVIPRITSVTMITFL